MNYRANLYKDRAEAASVKAKAVAEKAAAEGRAMTATEKSVYDSAMAELGKCLEGVKAARKDEAFADHLRAEFGGTFGTGTGTKSDRRLSFKGMAGAVVKSMVGEGMGTKALAPSGAAVVAQGFTPDPVALGRPAQGLLDILPVTVHGTAEYAFLSQGTRTNNADVVAEGDTKPTSVIGLTRVEQTLAVIAHLSEGIPRYWVLDNTSLETFVANELEYALRAAVEAKVLADVNGTSGIQTQAYSTSVVQTIRKALTKVEVAGYAPGAIVLHPSDFETVELGVSTANAIEYAGLPFDAAARRLFGVPIAVTVSATAGVGHVLAADAVGLDTDSQGVQVQWSENSNATDFAQNLVRCRVEGRYGTSVYSPLGVVVATLD